MNMTLLITGGAGFIGSAVIRKAIEAGHKVVNVDCLTYAANLSNLTEVESRPDYAFEPANICDRNAIRSLFSKYRPDGVIHLAAESHVDRSIDAPHVFLETNVMGTANLLEITREYLESGRDIDRNAFRFVHVSTDEVYGDLSLTDPAFTEQTPYNPSSPYSASKAASDHMVRAWGRTYGIPAIISNCSNNYGPFQFPEKLIPVTILRAIHGQSLPIYGDGTNIRDWLYVEDHADAILTMMKSGRRGETYNVGGNSERTNIDLVRSICRILEDELKTGTNYQDQITFVADRPGHDQRYAINATKIQTELGWEPKTDIDTGLRATVQWYLSNENWWKKSFSAFNQRLGLNVGAST